MTSTGCDMEEPVIRSLKTVLPYPTTPNRHACDQGFALLLLPGSQNLATEKNILDLCPALRYAENSPSVAAYPTEIMPTRSLALLADDHGAAYEILFSFHSPESKAKFLGLI
jgi:hypothetical protein